MRNPPIAKRAIVAVEAGPNGINVSVYTPPSGIWRRSGTVETFGTIDEAREYAAHLSLSTGATIALEFEAATTPAKEVR